MTIDKTILAIEFFDHVGDYTIGSDDLTAMKLCIEAFKQLKAIRQAHPEFKSFLLLGETEE